MKLSLNWLKNYLNISYSPDKIAEMLTLIGLEVEGVEKIESVKGGLLGIVTGEVISCEKHPDADRLSVTTVNIGTDEMLQIVCGAPNVAKGQKVMVATIGSELHPSEGNPMVIKKGKIRGVESQGMICAEDELGIGTDHSGIIVLPEGTRVGMAASTYYNLENYYVFEVGLTPNRSDATSQLGIARDLLAYLKVNKGYSDELIDPDISGFVTQKVGSHIDVEILHKEACPRYTGITITNIEVKESPEWIKKLLSSIGVKSINNIVDITNFVLNELGQPLHAFDADKIEGKKIIVSMLQKGTEFVTLDGVNRKLTDQDLMICDKNMQPLCMAGVYGGINSGVTVDTKNVFLESACFNPKYIRKTSTYHNLRTDAAKIFEKGADPNITEYALKRAASLIRELAGGEISNQMVDVYPAEIRPIEVRLFYSNVNSLIGMTIPEEDVHSILQAMDMEITHLDEESILVKVPTNKADVLREVDLIEEILRIYGLNRVEVPSKIQSTISYSPKPNKHRIKEIISDHLSASGYNEIMGLSLIESKNYDGLNIADKNAFVFINNTSNIHLDIMRPEMMVSGLVTILYNLNRQQNNVSVYEFGKSYLKTKTGYDENEFLTILVTGKKNEESWLLENKPDKTFFDIKKPVLDIFQRLGVGNIQISDLDDDPRLAYGQKLHLGPLVLAVYGEIIKTVLSIVGIKNTIYYAEISFEALIKNAGRKKMEVKEINRYPSVRRDLA
ncbi:MAG: phenylalanine--tRNA ligase subunit beta, partial [Saprospiraceae bacterium]|nr:phenylalanine--tRNA ligase subunit beta [Saprospiraceae bacterium]